MKVGDFTINSKRKSSLPFGREATSHQKSTLLEKEKGKKIISSRSKRKCKGSFCQTQTLSVRESNSNDILHTRKYIKPHHKTAKVSVNLIKTDKSPPTDQFIPAITLNVKKDDNKITQIEKSPSNITSNQFLSNKMSTQANSVINPTPFQNIVKEGSKEKTKTNLEIYSKTLKNIKGNLISVIFIDKSTNSNQRNWSDMQELSQTEEGKVGNVSATAISARSEIKNNSNQDNFSNSSNNLILKNNLSD